MDSLLETELAKHVIAYMHDEQWETYQEVEFRGQIADIVVTKGRLIGVVECKRALGFPVLEQAHRWLPFTNFVWAAVWRSGRSRLGFGREVAKLFGIGITTVHRSSPELNRREELAPAFRRKLAMAPLLRDVLRPEHKVGFAAAGSNRGNRFTPWANTCRELLRLVQEKPGIELREAIAAIRHHYSSTASARGSLIHWIEKSRVRGVRMERDGKRLKLFPSEVANG